MPNPRILLFSALLLSSLFSLAHAGNSVMIWPIDPKIDAGDKATELWLENRGDATTLMQVRVFGWQQVNGHDQYQTQQQVVASPPMVRIEPGKRQLVRLIKQSPITAGQELAYRVLMDEIPTPQTSGENQGLKFQMRYSVPLFVYGDGLTAESATPALSWRIVSSQGQRMLEVENRGSGHARLSDVTLGGRRLSDSLLGYVLADSSNRFPLHIPAAASETLNARLSESKTWQSKGTP